MRIYISKANPIRFVWENRTKPAAYNDFNYDDQYFDETVEDWEQGGCYAQKWQTTDAIRLQFISSFTGLRLNFVDADGQISSDINMSQKQADKNNPGFNIYEVDISLASLTPGDYRLRCTLGSSGNTLLSEPLNVQDLHEGTKYIEYYNSSRKNELIFEKGFRPSIRVEARWDKMDFGSVGSMWEDQPLNPTIIESREFDVCPLVIGNEYGCPDWVFQKLNMILRMDNVRIDGRMFTVAESNQKFEFNDVEGYKMRGAKINMRPSLNRSTNIIDTTQNTEQQVIVLAPAHTNFFGDTEDQGSNQILLLNYE